MVFRFPEFCFGSRKFSLNSLDVLNDALSGLFVHLRNFKLSTTIDFFNQILPLTKDKQTPYKYNAVIRICHFLSP